MRVVLDTNVIVSAFLSPRAAPAQILEHLKQEAFELLLSPAIFQEYGAALSYERVKKVHTLSAEQIHIALEDLKALAAFISPEFSPDVVTMDADGNMLFACALAGGGDVVVSGDAHVQSVKQYRGIQVLSPTAFVTLLGQQRPR